MFRIDDPSAAATLPAPEAAGTEGYWTEGNPATGVPATLERASWFNMIQEELRAICIAGGQTPSKTSYNQVLSAIQAMMSPGQVLAGSGYRKFPNGLIMQWGGALTDGSGNATVSYPIAFPSSLFMAITSPSTGAGNVISNGYNSGGGAALTTLLIKATAAGSPLSVSVSYIALGQ